MRITTIHFVFWVVVGWNLNSSSDFIQKIGTTSPALRTLINSPNDFTFAPTFLYITSGSRIFRPLFKAFPPLSLGSFLNKIQCVFCNLFVKFTPLTNSPFHCLFFERPITFVLEILAVLAKSPLKIEISIPTNPKTPLTQQATVALEDGLCGSM